ncbi:MAG: hypothetical protein NVS1B11_30060 [Terriglobales bacterium]
MTAKPVASPLPEHTPAGENASVAVPYGEHTTTPGSALGSTDVPAGMLPRSNVQLWFHRLGMLVFVSICAVVGVVLVILPWRPEWTDNHLLLSYPALRMFVMNSFVRGLCSGLGALDIWIGFSQAITYREESRV